ncbi:MAG TPA: tyrosine-type recombinase/integrase, partial [Candidatus Methylomirabilis sp.]|nr:tyrosine-type recombinase/integrase [Candidatus Methylomirabilis sp.]
MDAKNTPQGVIIASEFTMLQTGLRVGEVAALRRSDIALRDRAGTVRVRNGKGLKEREVPL